MTAIKERGVLEMIRRYRLVSEAEVTSAEFDAQKGKGEGSALKVLLGHELISEGQIKRLAKRYGKVKPACFKCLKLATFEKGEFTGEYECPYCKETISFKAGTAGYVEELLPNPPERAVDKIVEKLLLKAGVSKEQLSQLKQQVKSEVPRPSLTDLMLNHSMMPRGQVFKLKGKAEALIRKKLPQWMELRSDYELGRLLSMVMLVSHRTLSDALQQQFEQVIKGEYKPLRKALAAKGELTPYQIRKWLAERFDDRAERQELLDLIEEERLLPDQLASAEEVEVDWDDSMNELLLESRDLKLNLLDD